MSLGDITIENSIEIWGILHILTSVAVTFVFTLFGISSLVTAIYYPKEFPTNDILPTICWLSTIAYTFLISFRNRIIKKIFMKTTPHKLLEFTYVLKTIVKVLVVICFLTLFLLLAVPIEIYDFTRIFVLFFSFYLLYAPFFLMLASAITDSGEIRIVFEVFFSNINNFKQRQKWMKKFFKKLEEKLKKANMKVSSDKLIYHCNFKLMKSESIENNLKDIERWMLGEQIENIDNSIKQIIPEEEIKPLEKIALLDRFLQIPSDVRKYLFVAIIVVIIVVLKPEWIEKLIDKIL